MMSETKSSLHSAKSMELSKVSGSDCNGLWIEKAGSRIRGQKGEGSPAVEPNDRRGKKASLKASNSKVSVQI